MIISNALHDFLNYYGISRMDFANKIDIDQSHLSKLLGGRQASSKTIKKIEDAYNVFLVSEFKFEKNRNISTTIEEFIEPMPKDFLCTVINEYMFKFNEIMLSGVYIPTPKQKDFYLEQMKKCLDIINEKLLTKNEE